MKGLMNKHPILPLRKPEITSLSKFTSFNRNNVMIFHNNYEKVLQRGNFTPALIYNLDKTNKHHDGCTSA